MNAALEATIARDRRVSAIWRRVADGEIAFDAGAALLTLEAGAKRRLADEYDAAQERGEISKQGAHVPEGNMKTDDLGLSRKDIHEARMIRDADEAEPDRRPAKQKRVTLPADERAQRLADRKRLAIDAFPCDPEWADFTVAERAVAKVIGGACRMRRGCTLAVATIAERAFCSVRAVQAATKKLEQAGLIVCLQRRLKGRRNETNQIVIKSQEWLEYLRQRAVLVRRDRVQKTGVEQGSSYPVNSTRVGGKHTQRWFATTAKSEGWLARFRTLAGPCLNAGAGLLADPGPLTRLMAQQACATDDVLKGIREVRRRHERSGRSATVWSWEYFAPAIEAARDRRVFGVAA